MWHFGQIYYKSLVANGFSESDGQFHFRFLEFVGSDYRTHGNYGRVFIWHLDAHGSFSWYRSNDSDTQRGQRQSDVVFQVFDFGDTDTCFGNNFVRRYRWSNG